MEASFWNVWIFLHCMNITIVFYDEINMMMMMMIMMMMILYLLCLFMLACKVVCCSPSKCFLWSCLSLLSSSSSPLSSSSSSSSSSSPSPMSTHKSKQKCHLNDANVKIHHKRVDFSGLPILPEPPRDVEQDRLEEEINIFVNLYSILTGISHEMPGTPSIVKGNKSLNLVWFRWGSQYEEYWKISLKADVSLSLIGREKSSRVLS